MRPRAGSPETPARARDLSQAYLYLGIAYIGKGHEAAAKAQVPRGGRPDQGPHPEPGQVPAQGHRPVRGRARGGAGQSTPRPQRRAPAPAAAAKKGGAARRILIVGGLAAVGGGVALAAGRWGRRQRGGGSGTPTTTTAPRRAPQTQTFTGTLADQEQPRVHR